MTSCSVPHRRGAHSRYLLLLGTMANAEQALHHTNLLKVCTGCTSRDECAEVVYPCHDAAQNKSDVILRPDMHRYQGVIILCSTFYLASP